MSDIHFTKLYREFVVLIILATPALSMFKDKTPSLGKSKQYILLETLSVEDLCFCRCAPCCSRDAKGPLRPN